MCYLFLLCKYSTLAKRRTISPTGSLSLKKRDKDTINPRYLKTNIGDYIQIGLKSVKSVV